MSATPAIRRQRSRLATMSGPPSFLGHLDTGFQVEALLEIHVDEVVATHDAVQWKRLTVDLHPNQRRNTPGLGYDSPGDFFKIL